MLNALLPLLLLSDPGHLVRSQPGTIVSAPSAVGTNYALNSGSFCKAGNAADTSWTLTNATCANDAGIDPTGTSSMDSITTSNGVGSVNQAVTFASASATATVSTYANRASGSGTASMIARCTGSTATACTCYVSDGSSCTGTAGTPSAADCLFKAPAIGAPTVRMVGTATCSAAVTGWSFFRSPGDFPSNVGTARFWCGMIEPGSRAFPTCIPTDGAAVTCRR